MNLEYTEEEDFMFGPLSEPSNIDEIEEYLYLGGLHVAQCLELFLDLNIKYVLSVIDIDLKHIWDSVTYMKIDAEDTYMQDLLTYFPETNRFIARAQEAEKNVLVHCRAGISRSATIVVAFIMNKHKMSYESARELVNNRRVIWPNDGFIAQLRLYEKMGFTLNANNRQLRQHMIRSCLNSWTHRIANTIEFYFKRRDFAEQLTEELDLGKRYLCAKCDHHIFNEIHILPTNTTEESESSEVCDWTYIEPQKWMTELTQQFENMIENVVDCPQCGEVLFEFKNQFIQYLCDCPLHKGEPENNLHFRIANEKFKIEENV